MIDEGGTEVTLQSEQLNIDTNRFRSRLNSAIGFEREIDVGCAKS